MKKDHVLKDFFSYPIRFADFMNALFFDGYAIIHPCDLHPLDSREIFIGDFLSKERTHDVIMMWERKDFQAILILEAQSSVDFTMASRTLLYDALVYNMQDKRFKNHMLMPVMSVVLFHGEGKWNAVTSLLERVKGPEEIKRKQNDWKMRVVDMKEMDENLLKNEDNKKVISGLKTIWRKDEEGLKKMIITKAVARVLATLTGREDILEKMKGDGGTVEMYSFWKDAEKSGMEKGKQQGKLGLILLQLKKILGKLTPELEIKLEKSSEESLDTIGIHILEIHNEEDVLKWL
ncbi:Rpn family recombination-promoting nuclease/putative transposase [Massilimicrobiota timonensis]|uniref:Transposase (putative) YhgA-like domain-containing protein n=1 Tax=Massilimicrobiota timonensis TaxID=1776392 RepID=A0A1Y4T5Q1_9FIRM|nr:Rpn family recombination-promoting nuclease/putative transposase [Massilimicrobiota timonensis]OUQ36283.1 hypothetical protein B5E75_01805 [Massilimicrobiota timonensis]